MIKLHEAKILLENTNATISEIAFNLGFKDPKYFSKVFKEAYGESPSSFSGTS
jgi:AraC-like DNA-binding protein